MVAAAKLTRNGHRRARPLGLPRDGAAAAGGGVRGGDDGAQRARRAAAGAAAGAGPRGRGDGAGLGPVPHGHGRLDRGVPAGRVGAERWDSAPGRLNRPAGLTCGCPRRAEEQDTATGDTGPVLAGGCWHGKRESGWPQWGHEHSPLCPVPQRTTDTHPQQPPSSRVTTRTPPAPPRPQGCGAVPGSWQRRTPNCSGMPSRLRSSTPAWPRRSRSSRRSCEGAPEGSRARGLGQPPGNAETLFAPRSSRQALEQARVAIEELDDMKAMVKGLEEENTELRRQARHAEKEQHSLCSRAEGLQEENQRLLAEGQGLREQIQAQAARMASLEVSTWPRRAVLGLCHTVTRCPCPHPSAQAQLCRGTALLSARDTALAQAGQRAQELTAALEEYERMVQVWHVRPLCEPRQRPQSPWATAQPHPLCGGQGQGVTTPFSLQELRLETTRLRQQLGRLRDAWAMYGRDTCVGHVLRALWHPQLSILTLLSLPQAPVVPAQPAGHPGHGGGRPGKAGVRGDPAGCPQPLTPRFCPGHGGQGGGGRGRRG
ncbi:protein KASH5 isoform X2 [Catharus ustulatus]|uniref:protein KASH5 isoform X2 n=1 Tax=Catharus ustulatus TaxID=91951 RepID=UPI00140CC92A|nr:protein KASH5 isoform X2 [Catharus ustulatus]